MSNDVPDTWQETLDAKGLVCPEPLMLARNQLRGMAVGDVLYIEATDPSTERDFRNLCRFMGHRMVHQEVTSTPLRYWIERGDR